MFKFKLCSSTKKEVENFVGCYISNGESQSFPNIKHIDKVIVLSPFLLHYEKEEDNKNKNNITFFGTICDSPV